MAFKIGDKDIARAFQQLAKALLPPSGKIYAERSDTTDRWGVCEGTNGLHYEYEFSQPEAEIIAALLNWNAELEWGDICEIVALFEPVKTE